MCFWWGVTVGVVLGWLLFDGPSEGAQGEVEYGTNGREELIRLSRDRKPEETYIFKMPRWRRDGGP